MGKPEEVVRLFKTVDAEFGALDAFFNNAGILETASKFVDIAPDRLQRIVAVNTVGAFIAAQEAVRRMSTRLGGKGGVIVNMSSLAAKLGGTNEATDYAASKGAIDTLTVGLAKELATEGIRVHAVRPGLIYTDIHASTGDPNRVDRLKGLVPMQRGGTAEEVAEAVLWLCSDQSTYCTGHAARHLRRARALIVIPAPRAAESGTLSRAQDGSVIRGSGYRSCAFRR